MIYDYDEIIKKYGNWYKLKKAIKKEEIFKIDNGLYSTTKSVKEIDVIVKKYNNPIFTLKSAFYYYGISDVIPDKYYIASSKNGELNASLSFSIEGRGIGGSKEA